MKAKNTMKTGRGIARPGESGFPTPLPEVSGGVIKKGAHKGEHRKDGPHGGGIGGLGKASHPTALGHGSRKDTHTAVGFSKAKKKK